MTENLNFPPIQANCLFCPPLHVASIAAELQNHRRMFDLQFNITRSGEWSIVATIFTGSLQRGEIVLWDGQSDSVEVKILFRGDSVLCSVGDRVFKLKNANQIVLATLIESRKTPQSCNAA